MTEEEKEARRQEVAPKVMADLDTLRTGALFVNPPGEPYPRPVQMGFVHRGWRVYMSTRAVTRKAAGVNANPRVTLWFVNQQVRADAWIQIDAIARRVEGEEFAQWQERRFEKEGDRLRRAAAGMETADWSGWVMEPERVRVNGYAAGEAPVVFGKAWMEAHPFTD